MIEHQVEFTELSKAQWAAWRHVEDGVRLRHAEAAERLMAILTETRCPRGLFDKAMQSIGSHARVALHFHPDRFGLRPMTVAESLLTEVAGGAGATVPWPPFVAPTLGVENLTVSQLLEYLCRQQLNCGFQLPAKAVPDDFRGPAMPRLARRIAGDGILNAAVIGSAEATLHSQPESWLD
jgi:hypothetical protein